MKSKLRYPTFLVTLTASAIAADYYGGLAIKRAYRALFPDVAVLKTEYPVAIRKEGRHIVYKFQKHRPAKWLSLRQIPRQAVGAILMSEDSEFFQHKGYSVEGIRAAIEHNAKPGVKIKRGGSTITQQVVKNLFLSPEKTLTRKARELLLAVELERTLSKGKILETYLNIAEWGPGVYGIEQASQRYFGKPAANLTPRDAATLAFMLPNPNKYRYSIGEGRDGARSFGGTPKMSEFAQRRVDTILERMWKTGKISDEEYTSSSSESADTLPSSL